MELKEAIKELRKEEKRKFNQSVDLIVNLKDIDMKRDNVNTVVTLPHKIKDKKICGFLIKPSTLVKTITKIFNQRTVLDLINEMKQKRFSNADISQKLCPKFAGVGLQSKIDSQRLVVITTYDSCKYQIDTILWDSNPTI